MIEWSDAELDEIAGLCIGSFQVDPSKDIPKVDLILLAFLALGKASLLERGWWEVNGELVRDEDVADLKEEAETLRQMAEMILNSLGVR